MSGALPGNAGALACKRVPHAQTISRYSRYIAKTAMLQARAPAFPGADICNTAPKPTKILKLNRTRFVKILVGIF